MNHPHHFAHQFAGDATPMHPVFFRRKKNLAVGEVFLFLAYWAGYGAAVRLSAVSSASMNSGTLMGLVR